MTKQLKLGALFIALLASSSVFAVQHNHAGYTETSLSDGKIVKNSYGECWQNSFLEIKSPECGGVPEVEEKVVTLQSNFLFGFDKDTLRPEAIQTLNEIAAEVNNVQLESISVEGHTDFKGSEEYNQKLSERRANRVRDYLISQGVPDYKISAIGLGETATRMTEQCEAEVAGIKNKAKKRTALIQCIEPDRRTDIRIRAIKTN